MFLQSCLGFLATLVPYTGFFTLDFTVWMLKEYIKCISSIKRTARGQDYRIVGLGGKVEGKVGGEVEGGVGMTFPPKLFPPK